MHQLRRENQECSHKLIPWAIKSDCQCHSRESLHYFAEWTHTPKDQINPTQHQFYSYWWSDIGGWRRIKWEKTPSALQIVFWKNSWYHWEIIFDFWSHKSIKIWCSSELSHFTETDYHLQLLDCQRQVDYWCSWTIWWGVYCLQLESGWSQE